MANEAKNNKKRKRRAGGVPTLLVVVLLIIALAMGGLGGFFIARKNAPVNDELEKAKVITPFMTASTENRCDLYFRVQDVDHQRFVDLKSKAKIPVSKKLLDTLDEANIRYKINADF